MLLCSVSYEYFLPLPFPLIVHHDRCNETDAKGHQGTERDRGGALTLPQGVNLLRGFTLDMASAQEIITNKKHEEDHQPRNRASPKPSGTRLPPFPLQRSETIIEQRHKTQINNHFFLFFCILIHFHCAEVCRSCRLQLLFVLKQLRLYLCINQYSCLTRLSISTHKMYKHTLRQTIVGSPATHPNYPLQLNSDQQNNSQGTDWTKHTHGNTTCILKQPDRHIQTSQGLQDAACMYTYLEDEVR